jgi:general stress protein 26
LLPSSNFAAIRSECNERKFARHGACEDGIMTTTEDLDSRKAVEKMREIVLSAPTCFLAAGLPRMPFHLCPMYAQDVDRDGAIWFFSGADSIHNELLAKDARVELMFSNNSKHEYLAVFGHASICHDIEKIDELWGAMVKAWFPGGKDDPNLTLIRVEPEKVHYWDTRDNKLVALGKILLGAVTGRALEAGVEGDLRP